MNKKSEIRRITIIGLVLNIIISTVKLILGLLGNSQAVVADAAHSFSDTSTGVVILFGVKHWTAPPDNKHPFGHQKIESIITIIIGLILLIAAGSISYNAIISIKENHSESIKLFTIIGIRPKFATCNHNDIWPITMNHF